MKYSYVLVLIIFLGAGVILWRTVFRAPVDLPKGETVREEITIEKNGEFSTGEIMVTDGVTHSIPLEELLDGGVGKDGIPPIDNPAFTSVDDAREWLADDEPGVIFSQGNTNRFYPYKVLVRHEIVNDTVEGKRVLITYCPLCLTGFVFDPVVQGERVEFGVSGLLWKSNLVMYDRKTDSLWPQILGEAVVGEMTGATLTPLPSDQALFGKWRAQYPNGEVLSRELSSRAYNTNPYGSYYEVQNFSLRITDVTDSRLPNGAFVLGIVIDGKAKAYLVDAVKEKGEVKDTFAGTKIVLRHDPALDVVRIFKTLPDGSEERINPFSSFWFSWAAVHPDTEVYK